MTARQLLQTELQDLRTEVQALKEQMAQYAVHPPIATDHPHIVRIEGVQGGEPLIRGVYVTVRGIVEMTTRLGQTPEQLVKEYAPLLSLAQIYDALSYYYDHRAEIETDIEEHAAALQRVMPLSRVLDKPRKSHPKTKKSRAHA